MKIKLRNLVFLLLLFLIIYFLYSDLQILFFKFNSNCRIPKNSKILYIPENDSILRYSLMPNVSIVYDGEWCQIKQTIIKTNSYGFRDYEFSLHKNNKTIRIAAIGDSFTLGQGINVEYTWPKTLEKILNERNRKFKYEVYNFGVSGYNFEQYFRNFEKKALLFKPDIVIIVFINDDILDNDIHQRLQENSIKYFEQISKEYKLNLSEEKKLFFINNYRMKLTFEETTKSIKNFDEYFSKREYAFDNFSMLIKNNNISVVFVYLQPSVNKYLDLKIENISKKMVGVI